MDFDIFEQLQERRPVVPWHVLTALDDHIAFQRRERNIDHVAKVQIGGKFGEGEAGRTVLHIQVEGSKPEQTSSKPEQTSSKPE